MKRYQSRWGFKNILQVILSQHFYKLNLLIVNITLLSSFIFQANETVIMVFNMIIA